MEETLFRLLTEHVYLILFVSLILEFVALPIPGETMMVLAGVMGYYGHANYLFMIISGSLGTIIGMQLSYEIGRRLGTKAIDKYGSYIGLTKSRMTEANKFFNKYGNIVIIIAYYLPGVRHILGYFSGISRIDAKKFHIYSTFGGILWVFTFITMGYILGPSWKHVFFLLHRYGIILVLLVATGLLIYILYKKLGKKEFFLELKAKLKFIITFLLLIIIVNILILINYRNIRMLDESLIISSAIIFVLTLFIFIKYNIKNKTSEKLLVVVDYQKDFVDGSLGFSEAEKIEAVIENKIKDYLEKNQDIIFTLDTHKEDYFETREGKHIPVEHCKKDTEGHQVHGHINQYLNQAKRIFEKESFGSIDLAKYISKSQYKEVEFCGLVSNICVLSNIVLTQSYHKDIEIRVDLEATASNKELVNKTLKEYLQALGVKIL
ncbi:MULTISPECIES: isochorismatase family protein [unclassified Gemella]|uniref:isochorismatase family protein n=1 Tax=unclassified Gemella TaxID=2624949 RepID=UPI001C055E17|nr:MULTISPECIES: isochorismatase family protein [unclassified Gemella]MBU0278016.1 isochorismatase family protein [Gemella sp. zg-1178]QWQ38453.1 isochorismatase family protein [Gemella sp. zg-570]